MKQFIIITFLIVVVQLGFTQVDVKTGPVYDTQQMPIKFYVVEGNQLVSAKQSRSKLRLSVGNSISMSEEYGSIYKKFVPKLIGLETLAGRVFAFFESWSKNEKKTVLSFREIDLNTGSFKGEHQVIERINGKIGYHFPYTIPGATRIKTGERPICSFEITTSKDGSHVMIHYRTGPEKSAYTPLHFQGISVHVLDSELKELYQLSIESKVPDTEVYKQEFGIKNDGSVVYASSVNDKMEITRYFGGEEVFKGETETTVYHDGFKVLENTKGGVVACGVSNYGTKVFTIRLSADDRLSEPTSCSNEDSGELVEYANEKGGRKVLRDVIELENGDLIVLSEKVEVVGKTYTSGNSTSTMYTYYYEHAVISKVSAKGSLLWCQEIPKLQQGINGKGRMSYKYILDSENNHFILFLDNPGNLNEPNRKKLAKYLDNQGGNLVRYKIENSSGEMTPKVLFEVENVNGLPLPEFDCANIRYLKGSEILSEVLLGADSRLIRFSVD